jgi:hypothetical protein
MHKIRMDEKKHRMEWDMIITIKFTAAPARNIFYWMISSEQSYTSFQISSDENRSLLINDSR